MDFESKWTTWAAPIVTAREIPSAKSANTTSTGSLEISAEDFGTSGTLNGGRRWIILDSFTVDPFVVPAPTSADQTLPFKEICAAIHHGNVALVWSRPCCSWTYWVYGKSEAKTGREKFPTAVIYTLKEVDILCRVRIDRAFLQTIHSTKEVFGGHLEGLEQASPKNPPDKLGTDA